MTNKLYGNKNIIDDLNKRNISVLRECQKEKVKKRKHHKTHQYLPGFHLETSYLPPVSLARLDRKVLASLSAQLNDMVWIGTLFSI